MTDFCSHLHITPIISQFDDDDNDNNDDRDLNHFVSDQSLDIAKEAKLKMFTRTLQMAHIAALKKENRNKQGMYSKRSKTTLKCCKQSCIKLGLNSFLPVDEYWRLKGIGANHNNTDAPISELDNIIDAVRDESEESSNEAKSPVRDTCAYNSVSSKSESVSEVESEEALPAHNVWFHLRHHACMESEESTENDEGEDKICMDKEHTAGKDLEVLRHVLAHQNTSQQIPGSIS